MKQSGDTALLLSTAVKKALTISDVPWPSDDEEAPPTARADLDGSAIDSDMSYGEDIDEATVRKKKKDLGLNLHVNKDHVVLQDFKTALKSLQFPRLH